MWGRGLKQRETRDINIQPKAGEFCGFFKIFDATPQEFWCPEEDSKNLHWTSLNQALT